MNDTSYNSSISPVNDTLNQSYPKFQLYSKEHILAYQMFLSMTIAFGVPGNLIVLVVFIKMKVSSSTDWFIIFITGLDFVSSVANVPVYLTFSNGVWKQYGSDTLCKLHMYFSQAVVTSSALMTGGLALERYLKVCRPYSIKMSRNTARNICSLFCILAALSSIPSAQVYHNKNGACITKDLNAFFRWYFSAVFGLFIIVFITVSFCYTKIVLTIRKSERTVHSECRNSLQRSSLRTSPTPSRPRIGSSKVYPTKVTIDISLLKSKESAADKYIAGSTDDNGGTVDKNKSILKTLRNKEKHETDGEHVEDNGKIFDCGISLHTTGSGSRSEPTVTTSFGGKPSDQLPLQSTKGNATTGRVKTKTTTISFLVCVIFIVSWIIPWSCFVILQFDRSIKLLRFILFGTKTYLINTFTNPFLYGWLNMKFRQKLKACFNIK